VSAQEVSDAVANGGGIHKLKGLVLARLDSRTAGWTPMYARIITVWPSNAGF
jgi:hypothetical protein